MVFLVMVNFLIIINDCVIIGLIDLIVFREGWMVLCLLLMWKKMGLKLILMM